MPVGLEADNFLFNDAVCMLMNVPSLATKRDFHIDIIDKLKKSYAGFSLAERLETFCRPAALLAMYNIAKNCINKSELSTFKLDLNDLRADVVTITSDVRQLQNDMRKLQSEQAAVEKRMDN
jgi:outer membrane murein-binding lipoprotein Lpp